MACCFLRRIYNCVLEERNKMQILNRGYVFPAFWIGLIVTTYLGIGEYYIMVLVICIGLFWLTRVGSSIKVRRKGGFKYFVLYYVIISIFGLATNFVGIRNYIELIMKYIFLPIIIFYLIPNESGERITMLKVLKALILVSAIYGLIETMLGYNFMVDFVRLESRAWMIARNSALNYQPCSFFLHYNYYGCVLILGLVIGRYIPYKNKVVNYLYWILILEQLLMCQSRICWIAAAVITIIEVLKSKKITNRGLKKILVVILAIICVVIFNPSIIASLFEFIGKRFSRLWIYGFEDGSLGQRLGTLMNWPIYFQKNIIEGIFGTGYQSVSVKFMSEYSYFRGYSTADCQLTIYLVETGIIGVAILLFAIIRFLKLKNINFADGQKIVNIGKMGFVAFIVECFTLDIVSNNIMLSLMLLMILIVNKKQEGIK